MQKHIGNNSKQRLESAVFDIRDKLQDSGLTIDKRQLVAITLLLILTVAGSALYYINSRPKPVVIAKADENRTGAKGQEGAHASAKAGSSRAAPEPAPIYVHVAGAAERPGVYRLKEGSRVIDAIEAAGGEAEGAVVDALNLAAKLVDGERVYIPKRDEAPQPVSGGAPAAADPAFAGAPTAKVNINAATAEQLDSLPGVGEVTARKIIDYRDENGPFRRVEDIMRVDGIGKKKFESLKDEISVE